VPEAPQVRPEMLHPSLRPGDRGYDDGPEGRLSPDDFNRENLPQLLDHELEFTIEDVTKFSSGTSVRSDPKTVGNFRFRILVFPAGTAGTNGGQVSCFVEADPLESLDPRWSFPGVKYQLTIVNCRDYRNSVTKSDSWSFSKDGIDRGWHDMVRVADLHRDGWLGSKNCLYLRASCYVRVADGIQMSPDYSCKKETGFVGLKNHGATCYMNGLLQSLFHVGEFRRIVYSIEGEDSGDSSKEDPKMDVDLDDEGKAPQLIQALQNVFYKLQTSDQAVNCRELMKSFGWDSVDAFTQHDAQELNRLLCDRLEERMKNTPSDGSIKRLFEGEMENYIECIDVDYKSKRCESFYDIQLNIRSETGKDLANIEESLREFTTEETLEGDNLYEAEGHGKQRAKKGIRFLRFPPVLNLQLKRFHFDLEKMDMVKLNSRFEFPRKLDLSKFAPDGGKYLLFAVVVHNGDVNSGHYYAHIRPDPDRGWFKFDDEHVTVCSDYAAIEDNYGGSDLYVWNYFAERRDLPQTKPRIHNAYMLVYIREDHFRQILEPPDPKVTNLRMVERCDREVRLAEQRRREKMEGHSKIKISLIFEKSLCKMEGLWDHEKIPSGTIMKMSRDQPVKDLIAELAETHNVGQQHIAIFCLLYRSSPRQVRFDFVPPSSTFKSCIPQYQAPHFDASDPCLVMFCLLSRGYDVNSLTWQPTPGEEAKLPDELSRWDSVKVVFLVVKYFCAQTKRLITLGCHYMPTSDPIIGMISDDWVLDRLQPLIDSKEVAPLPDNPDTYSWECWEEFSEREIQTRLVKRSVKHEQLVCGDVIIWQTLPSDAQGAKETISRVETDIAPEFPVITVADFAAHQANSCDVTIVLHDFRQPLVLDGIVANGSWGQARPQSAVSVSKEPKLPEKEERPEDAALSTCLSSFSMPQETDLKMDLRWEVKHVQATVRTSMGLTPKSGNAGIWVFPAPPSSTVEDPLHTAVPVTTQKNTHPIVLEDMARYVSPSSNSRKHFTLHCVELPYSLDTGAYSTLQPVCIRFFDDQVREIGCEVVLVPIDGEVNDVIVEVQKQIIPEWNMSGQLRVLEVVESRVNKVLRPETPLRSSSCTRTNIFYHSLRIEADREASSTASEQKLQEIFHCDRASQQAFGHPLMLAVSPGEKAGSVKQRCKEKLQVPDQEFKSWRLVRCSGGFGRSRTLTRVHLKDDEPWDGDASGEVWLYLEHVHPNPPNSLASQSRHNKPLTIKA